MIGWDFFLFQPVTVTQVGWYDAGQDGLSRDFQVGLWGISFDNNNIQFLGSPSTGIVIPGGASTTLNGVYRVVDLPVPLELQPGGYVLAGEDTATTPDTIKYAGGHYDNEWFENGGEYFTETPGFTRPNIGLLSYGVVLGPTLFIAVPEPSSFALLVAGIGLLAGRRKLRA